MTERTTVRLPDDLLRRAKRKAAAEGRTLTSLIEEGLRSAIAERRTPETAGRVMPRVSQARGGLVAGVDLAALQEAEDLDSVRRLQRSE
jgi:predicted transcriptional regulator